MVLRLKRTGAREFVPDCYQPGRVVRLHANTGDFMLGALAGDVAVGELLACGGRRYHVREVRDHIVIVEKI